MRKPKQLDTYVYPFGRPAFWIVFVSALALWTSGGAVFVTAGCALAIAAQLAEERRRVVVARIRESLRLANITFQQCAFAMYGDVKRAPDLEKALNGERPLDLWKVEFLDDEFHRIYATLVLIEKGAPTLFRKTLRMVFQPDVTERGAA